MPYIWPTFTFSDSGPRPNGFMAFLVKRADPERERIFRSGVLSALSR